MYQAWDGVVCWEDLRTNAINRMICFYALVVRAKSLAKIRWKNRRIDLGHAFGLDFSSMGRK